MKLSFRPIAAVAIGALFICHAVACSSSNDTSSSSSGGTSPDGGKGSSSSSGGSSGGGSSSGGSSSGDGGSSSGDAGDQACASMGTACGDCCYDHHQAGGDVLDNAWFTCVCETPGACATQCAQTDCSMSEDAGASQPGDSCDSCEQGAVLADGGGACGPSVSSACKANADCVAFALCMSGCP